MEKSSKRKISHLKRVSAVDVPNYGSPTEHSPPYKVCQICRHIRVTYASHMSSHTCHNTCHIRITYASHTRHIRVTYLSHTLHITYVSHTYLICVPSIPFVGLPGKNVAYSLSTNVITLLWPHWPLSNSKAIDPKFSKEYSLLPHLV